MRKSWGALLTVTLAIGFFCGNVRAADEGAPPAAPPPPAMNPAPAPPGPTLDREAEMVRQMIQGWEPVLGKARADQAKNILDQALSKGKTLENTLENKTAAFKRGEGDVVRNLAAEIQEQYAVLSKYFAIIPIFLEMDRTKALQEDQGKDNPELTAHCQKILDLLDKKLELQTQLLTIENELTKERQALQQPASPQGMTPAVPPMREAPKPPPAAESR